MHLRIPNGNFPSDFPTNVQYTFGIFTMHAICHANLIFLSMIALKLTRYFHEGGKRERKV
jgi:hypothetical protein